MSCKIKIIFWLYTIGMIMFFISCDITVDPISESEPLYSISGPLDLQTSPNYIRVHDITALLNPEETRELDVQLIFTNLSTMESVQLQDSIILFDNIYTHNFVIEKPIEFDTRYKIEIEDRFGLRDSLISVTTKQTTLSKSTDTVSCSQMFLIELSDIDFEAGERLDAEVAVQVSNTWHWTRRTDFYDYNDAENLLTVGWSPNSISRLLWPPPAPGIQCGEFSAQQVRFRFTHIGYVEGEDNSNEIDFSPTSVQQRNVLSRYVEEVMIHIEDDVFNE